MTISDKFIRAMDISSPKSTSGIYIRISSGFTDVEGIL